MDNLNSSRIAARSSKVTLEDLATLGDYVRYCREDPNPSFGKFLKTSGKTDKNKLKRRFDAVDEEFDILSIQHTAEAGGRNAKTQIAYPEQLEAELAEIKRQNATGHSLDKSKRDGQPTLDGEILAELIDLVFTYIEMTKEALQRRATVQSDGGQVRRLAGQLALKSTPLAEGDIVTRNGKFDRKIYLQWLRQERARLQRDVDLLTNNDATIFQIVGRHVDPSQADESSRLELDDRGHDEMMS